MTLKVVERRNSNALAMLEALVDGVLADIADVGKDAWRDNVSAGPRSGVHYAGQPRVSSAPGEYSQEQTSTLKNMIESGKLGPLEHFFGPVPQNRAEEEEALAAEFGAPRNNLVGRANGRRTALDSRVHARMVAVVKRRT